MVPERQIARALYLSDFIFPGVAPRFNLLLKFSVAVAIMRSGHIQSQGMVGTNIVIESLVLQPGPHSILNILWQVVFQPFCLIRTIETLHLALCSWSVCPDMHWQN